MIIRTILVVIALQLGLSQVFAQAPEPITPGDFEKLSNTWSEVGGITLDPVSGDHEILAGAGVLLNLPTQRKKGQDIRTTAEYGDFDLSLEYLMFPESNSGIYLQGRYEVQLFDSWRKMSPASSDNGGIYQRYSDEGRELDGHPPRENASRAPGLWQKMEISFQAPTFDNTGKKITNARILRVVLNGITIHENVELVAPTGGGWGPEAALGPLRIQGDHGAVAFKNIMISTFDSRVPEMSDLKYSVYKGVFTELSALEDQEPVAEGSSALLSARVSPLQNAYLIHFTGTLTTFEAGNYTFESSFNGGGGTVLLDGETVIDITEWRGAGEVTLTAGTHQVDLFYSKLYEWAPPGLRLVTRGPGIRDVAYHDENMNLVTTTDPIYLEAPTILRSFMDIPGGPRITRAVSVGTDAGVHYTYDMDHGALVHAWRGAFIDATPMWNNRGDGSSRPRGAITTIDGINLVVRPASNALVSPDTLGTSFRPRGYAMIHENVPRFQYDFMGYRVSDQIEVLPDASGFSRKILAEKNNNDMMVRIGSGVKVEKVRDGLLRIDGNYYLRYDASANAEIRSENNSQSVWMRLKEEVNYEIIF